MRVMVDVNRDYIDFKRSEGIPTIKTTDRIDSIVQQKIKRVLKKITESSTAGTAGPLRALTEHFARGDWPPKKLSESSP